MGKEKSYCCSFCFKGHEEVDRLFVSFKENASICNECILLCINGVFKETAELRSNEIFETIDVENK